MSRHTKDCLIFNKLWQKICLIAIAVLIVADTGFCIIYACAELSTVLAVPLIAFASVGLIFAVGAYLTLLFGKKKAATVILIILFVICFSFMNTISFLFISGKSSMLNRPDNTKMPSTSDIEIDNDGIVFYNGKKYEYNTAMTTILFMGIDKADIDKTAVNGKNGQADAIYAVTIDTNTGKTTVICLSRDIMTDIKLYSVEGNYIRTERSQLCLSYAYGDGKQLSCENCVWSATNVLLGVPINTYLAMDYKAIAVLNDAVGGVEVPGYTSDWSKKTGKTVTLHGNKAYDYVHYRNIKQLESNNYRITRQIDYLKSFSAKAIAMTKSNISTPLNLYKKINDYSVSNLSADKITFLTSVFMKGSTEIEFKRIEGKTESDGEHAMFIPDESALYSLVLDVFYKEVG